MTELLAIVGLLSLLWMLMQRLVPLVALWRSRELAAWALAMDQTQVLLKNVWFEHWKLYRAQLEKTEARR